MLIVLRMNEEKFMFCVYEEGEEKTWEIVEKFVFREVKFIDNEHDWNNYKARLLRYLISYETLWASQVKIWLYTFPFQDYAMRRRVLNFFVSHHWWTIQCL